MHTLCWALAALGSLIGGIVFFATAIAPNASAPQEAAGAALAIGFAVLPYVFARAADELSR
jgi:hypothetical protein